MNNTNIAEATFDKEDLYAQIRAVMYKNRRNLKLISIIGEMVIERIPYDILMDLIDENKYIFISDEQIYWLAKALLELNKQYDLNINFRSDIEDYYTEQEVNKAELYVIKPSNNNEEINTIIFDDVIQIDNDEYFCVTTYGKLNEYYKNGILIYNYDTQRNPRIINTGMGLVYQPTIFRKSIEEMTALMVERKFFKNVITYNILHTGNETFDFDIKKSKLTFYRGKGSQLNIIDGFNRNISMDKALSINPELANEKMYLKILNYDANRALAYIRQEGKGNAIDETGKKVVIDDVIHNAVHFLNSDRDSLLKNKISDIVDEVYFYNTKYVSYETIMYAIEDFYSDFKKVKIQSKINNNLRHIIKVINYIIEKYYKEFEKLETLSDGQTRENIFIKNNMFLVYIWIAKKVENDELWDTKIDLFLDELNSNLDLLTVNIDNTNIDKKYRNRLIKDSESIWNKVITE